MIRTGEGSSWLAPAATAEISALLANTSARTLMLGIDKTGRIRQHDRAAADVLSDVPSALLGTDLGSLLAGELLVPVLGQTSVGQLLVTDQNNLDFTSATAMVIVILVIGVCVDALFAKADLSIRRRRGLLDRAAKKRHRGAA